MNTAMQYDFDIDVKDWQPNAEQEARRERIYNFYKEAREILNASYPEFNDRTLAQFLDDSQKRANGYVRSREDQGKLWWQSNVFTPFTRNKIKAHIAGIAKDVPKIQISAVNVQNSESFLRAEVMKYLIGASFTERGGNPERVIVQESWNGATNGTVIKYDGYVKRKDKVRSIISYNPTNGDIELGDEEEVVVEDRFVDVDIPVHHLYISNPYIGNIQDQPELIWRKMYTNKEAFLADWGNYKNSKYVPEMGTFTEDEVRTFFGENNDDVSAQYRKKIEMIRYYSKLKNEYVVYANRVEIFSSPLLWGNKKKFYPFSKEIFEQFANSNFFWGNSLPNILMGDQDTANAFLNAMNDKTYRTLNAPRLVDIENRDALELEDEYITGDTNIYVRNVDGVKTMPVDAVNQSEFAMLEKAIRGIDLSSVDAAQQGVSGSGSTAREIVIANQRADEIKGLFYINMKNLWLQKYTLRVQNILVHYNDLEKVKKIVGEEKTQVFKRQFNFNGATLADGSSGRLEINVFKGRDNLPSAKETGLQEMSLREFGQNVDIINITSDYLDNWEYYIKLETESFRAKDKALDIAKANEKLQGVMLAFPERFQANKNEFFREFMRSYDDDPERYALAAPALPMGAEMISGGVNELAQGATPAPGGNLPALSGINI